MQAGSGFIQGLQTGKPSKLEGCSGRASGVTGKIVSAKSTIHRRTDPRINPNGSEQDSSAQMGNEIAQLGNPSEPTDESPPVEEYDAFSVVLADLTADQLYGPSSVPSHEAPDEITCQCGFPSLREGNRFHAGYQCTNDNGDCGLFDRR